MTLFSSKTFYNLTPRSEEEIYTLLKSNLTSLTLPPHNSEQNKKSPPLISAEHSKHPVLIRNDLRESKLGVNAR